MIKVIPRHSIFWSQTLFKLIAVIGTILSMLVLSACQTTPSITTSPTQSTQVTKPNSVIDTTQAISETTNDYLSDDDIDYPDDSVTDTTYQVEPYIPPIKTTTSDRPTSVLPTDTRYNETVTQPSVDTYEEYEASDDDLVATISEDVVDDPIPSTRDQYEVPQTTMPSLPSHSELLKRARQNSQQQTRQAANDSSDLPAFRNLMQVGVNHLKSNDLTAAESSFTRAQRLAPRSSAVYFYLSQVALKKNQPRKAEAMARRGLNVSQDANRRRALWQLILRSGQAQNSSRVINEAQRALQ